MVRKMGFTGLAAVDLVAVQVRVVSQPHRSRIVPSRGSWLVGRGLLG